MQESTFRHGKTLFYSTMLSAAMVSLSFSSAYAACTPTSGSASGATVNCTGATVDQDAPNGYGGSGIVGATINVASGASVTGTDRGIVGLDSNILNNEGTITGTNLFGVIFHFDSTIHNSGTISSNDVGISANNGSTVINTNTGTITGGGTAGINLANNGTVNNAGTITGNQWGIGSVDGGTIINSGTITGTNSYAILLNESNSVLNTGTLNAGLYGIRANGNGNTLTSSGTINATDSGIWAWTNNNIITNSGTITAGTSGIVNIGDSNRVTNSGTINATGGIGIANGSNSVIINSGSITALNDAGITGTTGNTILNSGTITTDSFNGIGVGADSIITNSGTITSTTGRNISFGGNSTVTNSGTLSGLTGMFTSGQFSTITNSGTITSTNTGIDIDGLNNIIFNTGTINAADGIVNNGPQQSITNAGTINATNVGMSVVSGPAVNSGIINSGNIGASVEGANAVFVNSGTISATNFGLQMAALSRITNTGSIVGNVGVEIDGAATNAHLINYGLIQGTGGTAISFSASFDNFMTFMRGSRVIGDIRAGFNDTVSFMGGNYVYTFAGPNDPTTININTNGAPAVITTTQVAVLDPTALALEDRSILDVTGGISSTLSDRFHGTNPSDRKTTIWASGFGGGRAQSEDGALDNAHHRFGGVQTGADTRIGNTLVGAFVGGASGRLDVDATQDVDSDYVFGGGYGQYHFGSAFMNAALFGGTSSHSSKRMVANNTTATGMQNTTSSYDGHFISPEVTVGIHLPASHGLTLIPSVKLRHVAGKFDGYSETNFTMASRTVQDTEAQLELAALQVTPLTGGTLETRGAIGAIGTHRFGDERMHGTLIGTPVSFATPGDDNSAGGYATLGAQYHFAAGASVSANSNVTVLSDSVAAGARLGAALAF